MSDVDDVLARFRLTLPLAEIVIRGSAMYWFLLPLFRFVIRRDVGSIAIADMLRLVSHSCTFSARPANAGSLA